MSAADLCPCGCGFRCHVCQDAAVGLCHLCPSARPSLAEVVAHARASSLTDPAQRTDYR